MQTLLFAVGLLLFAGLVLVHEWGHYIVARRNGVKSEEFGLGFPPRAWGRRLKSGMVLSLNWLPLGGFVKLKGEHDADTAPGSFGAASLGAKSRILMAGVGTNLLVGLVILTALALVGMPKLITKDWSGEDQFTVARDTKVVRSEVRAGPIQADSPAAGAGLSQTDKIISLNGTLVNSATQLHDLTTKLAGQTINLVYLHDGHQLTKAITLRSQAEVNAAAKSGQPKGYLGLVPVDLQIQKSTWSAPIVAAGLTIQLAKLTLVGIGHAIAGLGSTIAGLLTNNHAARANGQAKATQQVGGPVAVGNILWGSGSLGLAFMMMIIAIISLTLAIINALPIPALDGGRLFVMLFTRAIRKPLSPLAEERVHGAGMAVLLALFVLITIVDVKRVF